MALADVLTRMAAAEDAASRPSGSTRLIAVSKTMTEAQIVPVLEQGHRDFGENRVQEAVRKWPELRARYPDVKLHLLGPLQTNKVRAAVEMFDAIHSLDRIRIAERIAAASAEHGHSPDLFVQVNTGEEPQKSGVLPKQLDAFIAQLIALGLSVSGLMCLPPVNEEPALHFGLLSALAERNGITGLSMGMSHNFETAVRLGASHVRVGTAIFGERAP